MVMAQSLVTMFQKARLNGGKNLKRIRSIMQIEHYTYGTYQPTWHGGIIIWIWIRHIRMISVTLYYVLQINIRTKIEKSRNSVLKNVQKLWKRWARIS